MNTNKEKIEKIVDEFELFPSDDIDFLIDQLTNLQVKIHPDSLERETSTKCFMEQFTRITDAKKDLRKIKQETDSNEILTLFPKDLKIQTKKENGDTDIVLGKTRRDFEDKKYKFFKNSLKKHRNYRISSTTVASVITFVCCFPNMILENSMFFDNDFFKNVIFPRLLIFWAISLITCIMVFFITRKLEYVDEIVFDLLVDHNFQGFIFDSFEKTLESKEKTFTKNDLEKFVFNNEFIILYSYIKTERIRKYLVMHRSCCKRRIRELIQDIAPEIVGLMILRGIEKGILSEVKVSSWNDVYLINSLKENEKIIK